MNSIEIALLRHAVIRFATSYVGVHEIGDTNRGALPDEALIYCGEAVGQPWCAAFACLMLHRAGVPNAPRNASSSGLYDWGNANNAITAQPQYGDFGLIKGGDTGHHHTVIVIGGTPDALHCIEGNEGNQVAVTHTRTLAEMDCINPYILA